MRKVIAKIFVLIALVLFFILKNNYTPKDLILGVVILLVAASGLLLQKKLNR